MIYSNGIISKQPVRIGTILNENFSGNLSKYLVVTANTGSFSIVSSKLHLAGGNGTVTNYLLYNFSGNSHYVTLLENWTQRVTFITPPSFTTTTFGFLLGCWSVNTLTGNDTISNFSRVALDSSFLGRIYSYTQNNSTLTQTTDTNFSLSVSTTYTLEVTRVKNIITTTLYNSSGVSLKSFVRTYNITSSNSIHQHNVAKWFLGLAGGDATGFDITNWKIESTALKNVDLLGVGDSNMVGLYAGSNANRFIDKTTIGTRKSTTVLAGIATGVQDMQQAVKQIIAMKPKRIYINPISNNLTNTYEYTSSYPLLINSIKAGLPQVKILHGMLVARNDKDVTAASNFVKNNYSGATGSNVVDMFSLTKNAGNTQLKFNSGDGLHLNTSGHTVVSNTLITALNNLT